MSDDTFYEATGEDGHPADIRKVGSGWADDFSSADEEILGNWTPVRGEVKLGPEYLAQAQRAAELGKDLVRWELVVLFILHHWHGLEVIRIGDGFSVMRKETR